MSHPLLLEPDELGPLLDAPTLRLIDLCRRETYTQVHIPGALHLDYGQLVRQQGEAQGMVPEPATLQLLFSQLGISTDSHVVAYDEEGGGRAARLLWTLEMMGHRNYSLLNGGVQQWISEQRPVSQAVPQISASNFLPEISSTASADIDYIIERLGDSNTILLDCRSADEYHGITRYASRAGHIPGAVNLDWMLCKESANPIRMRPVVELRELLATRSVAPEQEVIVYCQTHHRSSYCYLMLRSLGYARVRGYPGSWSEWGNRLDTPIA